jgi:hypothetical protein
MGVRIPSARMTSRETTVPKYQTFLAYPLFIFTLNAYHTEL